MTAAVRIAAIDVLKALAIVAVAFTHAGAAPWAPSYSRWDYWLCGVAVNFHVPTFLFLSGFLYSRTEPVPTAVVRGRLVRLLVPYLIASAVAYALRFAHAPSATALAFQVLTGSTLGIYYFIFLLALFIPATWGLSRLAPHRIRALCVTLWIGAVGFELYAHWRIIDPRQPPSLEGLFWLMRSPLNYTFAMFVTGWLAARHTRALAAAAAAHPLATLAACASGVLAYGTAAAIAPSATAGGIRMLYSMSVMAIVTLATRERRAGRIVRFASEATLGLYLYHFMFELVIAPAVEAWPAVLRIGATTFGGLAGAALLALAGQRVLGPRARLWLGA